MNARQHYELEVVLAGHQLLCQFVPANVEALPLYFSFEWQQDIAKPSMRMSRQIEGLDQFDTDPAGSKGVSHGD